MIDWIFLKDEYSQFDEGDHPKLPKQEVLAWDGRGGYLVCKLSLVHDGNSRYRMFVSGDSDHACLSSVRAYAIINKPKKSKK